VFFGGDEDSKIGIKQVSGIRYQVSGCSIGVVGFRLLHSTLVIKSS